MKYRVTEEKMIYEGEEQIWFLVEPDNWFMRFLENIFLINYSPHMKKQDAIKEAILKSKNNWYRTVSRKKVKQVSQRWVYYHSQ